MRTVTHSIRGGRTRAAVILLSGTMAVGAGVLAPTVPTAAAAPKCNYVSQDNRPELGESSEGDAVAQAQCLIGTRSGYPKKFDVSGIFGPETTEAVLWVQKCNEVKESGYTDEETWKVLYRAKKGCGKAKPTTKPDAKPSGKPDKSEAKPDKKPDKKPSDKHSDKPSAKPKPSGKPGSDKAGGDNPGSDKAGSDKAGSDKAGSGKGSGGKPGGKASAKPSGKPAHMRMYAVPVGPDAQPM